MAAGVKGIMAVGTDVFHIFAKAIMGTTVHKKLGNVSVALAVVFHVTDPSDLGILATSVDNKEIRLQGRYVTPCHG